MSPGASQALQGRRAAGRSSRVDSPVLDPWLIGAVVLLVGIGLVMVTSASVAIADRRSGDPLHYLWRQAGHVGLGVLAAWAATRVPLNLWRRWSPHLLVVGLLLLVLVLIPGVGREVNGSMRWLGLGPASLQPSELVKLLLPLYLAGYLTRRRVEVQSTAGGFIRPLLMLMLVAGLLLLEPDFGTTAVLLATALGMLFLGGVPLARFAPWVIAAGVAMAGIVMLAPYRLKRLTAFMDPWADPFNSGFQLTQALIAIGRGEWFGVGLGGSVQKLFYLPEAHTDFLFAVLGEEFGLAGMLFVIGLFALLVARAFRLAVRAEALGRSFAMHLSQGIGLSIGIQAFVNIGVNLGLLPTKGLTLPLMSYGGSSMLVTLLSAGLLLRVDRELGAKEARVRA